MNKTPELIRKISAFSKTVNRLCESRDTCFVSSKNRDVCKYNHFCDAPCFPVIIESGATEAIDWENLECFFKKPDGYCKPSCIVCSGSNVSSTSKASCIKMKRFAKEYIADEDSQKWIAKTNFLSFLTD